MEARLPGDADDFSSALELFDDWLRDRGPFTWRAWLERVTFSRHPALDGLSEMERTLALLLGWRCIPAPGTLCVGCGSPRVFQHTGVRCFPLSTAVLCSSPCHGTRGRALTDGAVWAGIDVPRFVPFLMLFAADYAFNVLKSEFSLNDRALADWCIAARNIMAYDLLHGPRGDGYQVGGPGIRVEIDESFVGKVKRTAAPFHAAAAARERDGLVQRWLWGAVEGIGRACGGDAVVVVLPYDLESPRSAEVLAQVLVQNVRPGSRIIHDDWGAYRAIDWAALPFEHDARSIVTHSKEIKNIFGEHTNHIEGVWSALKRWLRHKYSGRHLGSDSVLRGLVLEWAWRQQMQCDATQCVVALVEALQRLAASSTLLDVNDAEDFSQTVPE